MKASGFSMVLAVASAAVLLMSAGAWACGDGTDGTRNCGGTVVLGSWPCGAASAVPEIRESDVMCTLTDDGTLTVSGHGVMADYHPELDGCAPYADCETPTPRYYNITKVVIEEGVTHIGSNAFFGFSAINSITIPQSVTSIGETMACGEYRMTTVTIFGNVPPDIASRALCGGGKIYVPDVSVEAYRSADGWEDYDIQPLSAQSTSIAPKNRISRNNSASRLLTLRGKTLTLSAPANTSYGIRVLDVRGKTVSRFKSSGGGSFSLAKIPAGRYFVEAKGVGKVERMAVVVR